MAESGPALTDRPGRQRVTSADGEVARVRAADPAATGVRGLLAVFGRLLRAVRNRGRRLLPSRGTLDAFWEWDLQADTIVWHAPVNSPGGFPARRHIGPSAWWSERLHPLDRDRVVAGTTAALEGETDYWHDEYRFRRDDGSYADVLDRAFIVRNAAGKALRMVGTMTDITARKRVEDEVQARAEQQQGVAMLGQWALAGTDLQELLDDAVGLVCQTLRVDLCKVLERVPGDDSFLLRAGVGWKPGLVGRVKLSGHRESQAGYTLLTGKPVFVEDLTLEDRFSGPPLLHEHGVVSGLSVVIQGPGEAFGVLAAHTRHRRRFTEDDSNFLLAVANVLAASIARERADAALREQERLYRLVADSASDMVVLRDSGGRIRYVSPSCERLLGYTPDEFAALDDGTLVHPDHAASLQDSFAPSALTIRPAPATYLIRRQDGAYIWFESMATPVLDDHGKVVGIQTTSRDVTERKQAEEALRESMERFNHLAHHDPLTGLPNRVLLRDRLALALAKARRHRHLVGVAFLDLDRFKFVNDTLGHAMGDLLLQEVGHRLAGCVRSDDTVSRLGGDEFALVFSELHDAAGAVHVGNKVLAALKPAFSIQGRELFVTGSIGMSLFPNDGDDVDSLLRTADNAMYRAKEQGRDNLQLYADTMGAAAFERLTLETNLRKALDRGEILVHYQPQVALDPGGRVVAMEALARWSHPDIGLVPPADFIPLAEETGLIIPLGEIILRTACTDCRSLQREGWPELAVAVNVSGRQLRQPSFRELVRTVLRDADLAPRHLQLEITENLIMQDVEQAVGALRELRRLGIRLALDDFGTGHSSLGQMKLLTLDAIKIDRTFIRDLGRNRHDEAIVSAIVALARSLECQVIAEGVETEVQLRAVSELGCRMMQGYYFARPMPLEQCREFLRSAVAARG
jgi:diguanylate cyclase (GGDEF)-like protein/PAS domain S-box-containing protein